MSACFVCGGSGDQRSPWFDEPVNCGACDGSGRDDDDDRPGVIYSSAGLFACVSCGADDIDGTERGGWHCTECIAEGRPRVQPMEAAE